MRTFGTEPIDPDREDGPHDLTNTILGDLDALRQRIAQRLRFPRGTWQLDPTLGTDSILGHQTALPLVKVILADAIRDEGGSEVTGVPTITTTLDHDTRVMRYQATIPTIYGDTRLAGRVL